MIDHHVRFFSVTEQVDTESASGRCFLTVMGALNQMERETISERTKMALAHKRANGERLGTTPYGYLTMEGGRMVKHLEEQRVIGEILKARASGSSYRRIANWLNEVGVSTKHGGKWHASTVSGIANNQRYAK